MFILSVTLVNGSAQAQKRSAWEELAHGIFKELIEINTTHTHGNTTPAAEAMAKRLLAAGFTQKDVIVAGPAEKNQNLVVRMHGKGNGKPVLFLAHLDVVEALRKDWSFDPFKLTEQDGYFYGRGTMDIKDGASILVADFIRLKSENFVPDRDIILALTAGEEASADYNGVYWLLENRRALIDAEYCINMDAGDPQMKDGKRISRTVQASEKAVISFSLEVKNPGGHSSLPSRDNAIYRLADGLARLEVFDFPAQINEVTKSFFARMSAQESGQPGADMKVVSDNPFDTSAISRLSTSPYYNALMRTTCVATMLEGGHATNALPQTAKAIVNCRVLPGTTQSEVQNTLVLVLSDQKIAVTALNTLRDNPASPLQPEIMQKIEKVTENTWPGVMVLPVMEVGATDGIYLRGKGIPTYGVSGVFIDEDDVRAHGKDERIGVKDFYDGLEYEYRLIKSIGTNNVK